VAKLALWLLPTKITSQRFNVHSLGHEIDLFHHFFAIYCHHGVMCSAPLTIIIDRWNMCRFAVPPISEPRCRIGSHAEILTMLTAEQTNHEID
jgi:hypothetical protein